MNGKKRSQRKRCSLHIPAYCSYYTIIMIRSSSSLCHNSLSRTNNTASTSTSTEECAIAAAWLNKVRRERKERINRGKTASTSNVEQLGKPVLQPLNTANNHKELINELLAGLNISSNGSSQETSALTSINNDQLKLLEQAIQTRFNEFQSTVLQQINHMSDIQQHQMDQTSAIHNSLHTVKQQYYSLQTQSKDSLANFSMETTLRLELLEKKAVALQANNQQFKSIQSEVDEIRKEISQKLPQQQQANISIADRAVRSTAVEAKQLHSDSDAALQLKDTLNPIDASSNKKQRIAAEAMFIETKQMEVKEGKEIQAAADTSNQNQSSINIHFSPSPPSANRKIYPNMSTEDLRGLYEQLSSNIIRIEGCSDSTTRWRIEIEQSSLLLTARIIFCA
jgi:hypothetical protein